MLTVQTTISSVETEVRKGSSQSRYHGNTTGAQNSDAATGQAHAPGDQSSDTLLIHVAASKPTSTAKPTSNCGGATRSNIANTGPLNRKVCTYVPSEPVGTRP